MKTENIRLAGVWYLRNNMRVLFLTDDFLPKSFGGAGIITHNLAKGICDAGHEMYVITTVQEKGKEGWRELNGMKVYDLYTDYPQRLASYVSLYNFSAVRRVKKLIDEIKPDIIHAHNIHNYLSYQCLKVARDYTDKVFLTTHDAMAFNYGKLIHFYDEKNLSVHTEFSYKVGFLQNIKTAKKRFNPIRNIFIRYYLNHYPKKIFAISNRLKDALHQNGILNVVAIHYGIDTHDFTVSEDDALAYKDTLGLTHKKIVLFGGRLSGPKGGKIMIDTLKQLVGQDPTVVLLIAGTPNEYSQYLLGYAKDLGILEHVVFTGWLDRKEMKKAYAIANVVVTPSIYFDAFNLFNIEAGAAGKPVVGTCFGGTPEIVIDGVTGKIVNPNNIEMMKNALLEILHNPQLEKELGSAGKTRIEKYFTLDRYVSDTVDWYQKK